MRTQSEDTSPEMERVQIELIRNATPAKRFAIMQAWSQLLIEANKQHIRKDHPGIGEEDISLIFVARHYGQALADALRADLARRATKMNASQILSAIIPLVEVLEELGISYHIGGSVASSIYGILRATIDADLIADLHQEQVRPLVARLQTDYYIDEDMICDALRRRSSFNIIHLDTMLKVDVYIPKSRSFDQQELRRVQQEVLVEGTRPFYVASPEGTILNKLEWYKMGGEVSDRQWNDILGVLKVQGDHLDMAYLYHWAAVLQVTNLLERALVDAGLKA